jgi:DNA polymerase-3 subunit delta
LEKISKSLEKTPDFCVIIFHENESADKRTGLYKKIQKYGKIEEFKHKSPNEITRWIMDQSRNKDIKITPLTASYLTNHCGIELWKISNELEKLKIYAQNKEITNEMIDNLTTPSITSSIFKLTDKIAEKNTKEALKTLKNLQESGEDITRVFFMIVRHFRILIQAHDLIQKKETQTGIAKRLKQHPFVIQKTSAQSRNFTQEKLEKIYGHLLKIDKDFKTGSIKIIKGDNRAYILAIEKLIIDCCQ